MFGRGDGVSITARDRLLAEALEIYEQSICSGCGYSLILSTDPNYDGQFVARAQHSCNACAAGGAWQKTQVAQKREPPPGERVAVQFDFKPNP